MWNNVSCRKLKKISSWRSISLAAWDTPRDPSVYGSMEVDLSKALRHLETLNAKSSVKVTVTHLVIRAVALTLSRYPELNVLIRHRNIYLRDHVDIFVQVFLEEGGKADLSGAKIKDADKKSLTEIAQELSKKAGWIRASDDKSLGKSKGFLRHISPLLLTPLIRFLAYLAYDWNINGKWLGVDRDPFGGVMITSVGMFGLRAGFAPIVPFSRTPLLFTVGMVEKRPIAIDDKVEIRPMLSMTATADHRIIDGYLGSLAAKSIREFLENPEKL